MTAPSGSRSGRGSWVAIGALALVLALAAGAWILAQQRCIGDCVGRPTDCAGIERWLQEVRRDEVWPRGTSPLRRRRYRVAVPYRGGRPCGSFHWGIDAVDPNIDAAVAGAREGEGTITVTLRYWNPDADGDVVFLRAVGAEVTALEALGAQWAAWSE